ncbi:YitT family protein [Desulfovibrio sp. OttesenSCG-928-C06]|nr:YitT family protein [Desulfovibrio sp. OttesenSCG-928-C06]
MPTQRLQGVTNTVAWNLFLIVIGGLLFSIGAKALAIQHGIISGGLFGTGMLIYYFTGLASSSFWYFLLNIPLFLLGMMFLSRRFTLYTLFGFTSTSIMSELINFNIDISDPLLAAVAAGMICGAGFGLVIRSQGSDGGVTIIAIILHQKFNLRIGQVYFGYNMLLFIMAGFTALDLDKIMYSLIFVFITSAITDNVGSMFNQRKMAWIISEKYREIAADIFAKLHRGATFVHGRGAFTDNQKVMVLTVVHNFQIKALEEIVFKHDDKAFVIIENTFNVLGSGFSTRKRY